MKLLDVALTTEAKAHIWDILREECGASDSARDFASFDRAWPTCLEYRFVGHLGFGGKIWRNGGRVYVTCYREDETPEMQEIRDARNAGDGPEGEPAPRAIRRSEPRA